MPSIGRIDIHPIKALDPVRVREARVLATGALENDRRWALVDAQGHFVNGKNREAVHRIRAEYDLGRLEVTLNGHTFSLAREKAELERWMSERLNEPVALREDTALGFPDDTRATGPTFVGEASIALVAGWFELPVGRTRLRFRTNVEITGADAFWEDRLYGRFFQAGEVRVEATNACKRCVVPTRDPLTGEALRGFQKRFTELRKASLPAEADPRFFDHCYRFAVNTRIPASEAGKVLREGDAVLDQSSL